MTMCCDQRRRKRNGERRSPLSGHASHSARRFNTQRGDGFPLETRVVHALTSPALPLLWQVERGVFHVRHAAALHFANSATLAESAAIIFVSALDARLDSSYGSVLRLYSSFSPVMYSTYDMSWVRKPRKGGTAPGVSDARRVAPRYHLRPHRAVLTTLNRCRESVPAPPACCRFCPGRSRCRRSAATA